MALICRCDVCLKWEETAKQWQLRSKPYNPRHVPALVVYADIHRDRVIITQKTRPMISGYFSRTIKREERAR